MKTAFIGILNNPAQSQNSHSGGWNETLKLIVDAKADIITEKDDWSKYDRLIINHGPNFKPNSFNIIGGITPQVHTRINKFLLFYKTGKPVHQIDGFQMADFIAKRKLDYTFTDTITSITQPKLDKLVYGDSHSISVWPNQEYNLSRNDSKTLFGFLKDPVKADIIYLGNVDIRHHLCRQENPIVATLELVNRYIEFAKTYNATVTCLLPVESETRKIPTTGFYKGQPYYGSQQLRQQLVDIFNLELLHSGLNVIQWPQEWYQNVELYEKEVMEPKQSVHIKPKYYQRNLCK
jgi:hypothetical protein